ncbi:HD domain-containing protein [Halorubrum sp. SD626R]|uniref:HD domain-containing protein n=1 Tax=Halorubrum TaxID=56688 RepID=UPI0010FA12B5|nr:MULTISPECIES: HD domain-containing protein [Halorubrum]TKX78743.1 HD domain-containing protein [Halorubrum sp. SD626R]
MVPVGVEIKETEVSDEEFAEMKAFVRDYLSASVESEEDGGRMRWYPWHSADYRFNHILNVVDLATEIAESEGADLDVVRVAAVFHDVAKLEAEQDVHAEAGARVAREYLTSRGGYPEWFVDEVCGAVVDHSYTGDLDDVPLESRCLIEADVLDKVGANGAVLMLLRMGYESRTHMDAAKMVDRVLQRAHDHTERVVSDSAESIAHQRIKRVKWLREWLEEEVSRMDADGVTDR